MEITFDPDKRRTTLVQRDFEFLDAVQVFDAKNYRFVDDRFN